MKSEWQINIIFLETYYFQTKHEGVVKILFSQCSVLTLECTFSPTLLTISTYIHYTLSTHSHQTLQTSSTHSPQNLPNPFHILPAHSLKTLHTLSTHYTHT